MKTFKVASHHAALTAPLSPSRKGDGGDGGTERERGREREERERERGKSDDSARYEIGLEDLEPRHH